MMNPFAGREALTSMEADVVDVAHVIDLTNDSEDEMHSSRPSLVDPFTRSPRHFLYPADLPNRTSYAALAPFSPHGHIRSPRKWELNASPPPPVFHDQFRNAEVPATHVRVSTNGFHVTDSLVDLTSSEVSEALDAQLSQHLRACSPCDKQLEPMDRVCRDCAATGDEACDGEPICSACAELGIACTYPGDEIVMSESVSVLRAPRPAANECDPYDEFHMEESEDESISHMDLDSFEGIREILQLHESRMRAHRAFLTHPLLLRSKQDALQAPVPLSGTDLLCPFTALPVRTMASATAIKRGETVTLQLRSHKTGALKKWTSLTVPVTVAKRDLTILPKYKSIGRLGAALLAPNSYVKKYLPYFADEVPETERKREEDIEKWYQTDHDSMHRQRKCLEAVQIWRPVVEKFLSSLEIQPKDLLWYMLRSDLSTKCKACEKPLDKKKYSTVVDLLPEPDEQSVKRAHLATEALNNVAKIHMWHIVVDSDVAQRVLQAEEVLKRPVAVLCSICFLHGCMAHGAFNEPEDEDTGTFAFMGSQGARRKPMMINDDEKDVNKRISITVNHPDHGNAHRCGLFCVDPSTSIKSVLGRRHDDTVGGVYNRSAHTPRRAYRNHKMCGPHCFWQAEKRLRFTTVAQTKTFEPAMSADERMLFDRLFEQHASNQRAPCIIAREIDAISCMDAFYLLLARTQSPAHFEQAREEREQQNMRKLSKTAQGLDISMSSQLDERPPFVPCSHQGPCQNNPDCSCAHDKVACEYFCGCDADCRRRFLGCSCLAKNKACFNDDRCECWAANRECDPWVCRSCGADVVLDPMNKYREEVRRGRCKNVNMQLDLPARTIKAPSEVQGWGLYAGQNLETYAFVGEYKGEIVGNEESDRRGSIYHHLGQEYLFVTNNEQQIDGSNFGNKTRFINNSQRNDYINVLTKKLLCYGVQRVMLYAKRPIKAGDELLYNYNYPSAVTETFWERGEGPARVSGAVVTKPSLPSDGRIAKAADRHNGAQSDPRNRTQDRDRKQRFDREGGSFRSSMKRKRMSENDSLLHTNGAGTPDGPKRRNNQSATSEERKVKAGSEPEIKDSEESSSEEAVAPTRQRRIHAYDGRLGGNAQRKAWETRKNRAPGE